MIEGDLRALARVCRIIDDQRPGYRALLQQLFPHAQTAWVLGVTGIPGVGKSTLTDRLVSHYRDAGKRVGVVAVDPTSPFSGGAFLGDRIRLQRHFQDEQVFIRSLATRGALGGLSRSTQDTIVAVAAWQADVVIVETVGVGQDELDVTRAADTSCVVLAPGMGDEIQATKAGILEAADVFAVNKADRDGADSVVHDLEAMLALAEPLAGLPITRTHHVRAAASRSTPGSWAPPIVRSVATDGSGIEELVARLEEHRGYLQQSGQGLVRRRARHELMLVASLQGRLMQAMTESLGSELSEMLDSIAKGAIDPYGAADELWLKVGGKVGLAGR